MLKVGSCPNDNNFVRIFFCPSLCSIEIILFSESVPARKRQDIAENLHLAEWLAHLTLDNRFAGSGLTEV